ncbi:hypothetical protein COOONC_18716, partial [Cooperia oncophora]
MHSASLPPKDADEYEAEEKVRAEILSVVGPDGKPTLSDKEKMPYTKDAFVGGKRIPADTLIIADIQHMANSPISKDSHEFRPERFLMKNGTTPEN